MINAEGLKVKIFADGADIDGMRAMAAKPYIKGFTTNPTLMRKAGIIDYEGFAREVLREISDRPVSFEVFADDFAEMEAQARMMAGWGKNVYVKIPVTNTKGLSAAGLVRRLSRAGVQLNVTALMTLEQVYDINDALWPDTPANISVFAGRIADTGRELLNIFQADQIGCHIITVTSDVLGKLKLVGKDLTAYSLETVEMFYRDAASAGFAIRTERAQV